MKNIQLFIKKIFFDYFIPFIDSLYYIILILLFLILNINFFL
jgi:hypothetical protein